MSRIVIGTRASKLAVTQAEWAIAKLKQAVPELEVNLVKIKTTGDQDMNVVLGRSAGQGIFVKELEIALLHHKIDLAVHSLKDLPTEIPAGLSLAAVTERIDARDALISQVGKLSELAPGSRIGTGSGRRAIQLLAIRRDISICPIRGNIDTRLQKVTQGEVEGVIVAAAAMMRMGWQDRITEFLPPENFTPAVGQGALGIEIRSGDEETASLISKINHETTWQCVTAERTFLKALGGGCRSHIAALGLISGGVLRLYGMVANASGSHILRASAQGSTSAPEEVGQSLAHKMIEMGALRLIADRA